MAPQLPPEADALLARSNRLGSDPRNTNYAGGNTSAKGLATDPVTGEPTELMWVKGSGGDLGTLTADGLAVLRLDRLRALTGVYPGVDREDEMVAAPCTGCSTRRTWTTCTRTRGSRSRPPPTASG
jgi:rhamnose utilization protein RhaD (predicted bifunctional aldolase and dehydrogenase)